MKAVILAAGKGTRMKEMTKDIPKPMLLIRGKPMLEYIISSLRKAGITDFSIVVGYKSSVVQDYFNTGSFLGVTITYCEQTVQNGTGSALHIVKDFVSDNPFFFSFGDIITPHENYLGMINFFCESSCDALLGLNSVDDPYRGAAVYLNDNMMITNIVEKPPKGTSTTNLNNAGIMILTPEIFSYTSRLNLSPRGEYELTDVFRTYIEEKRNVKGYLLSGYWRDVGTPDDLTIMNNLQW